MSNLIEIPSSTDETKALLEVVKRGLDSQIELVGLIAKIRRAKYDAHIAEGFTPEQALEICKSIEE